MTKQIHVHESEHLVPILLENTHKMIKKAISSIFGSVYDLGGYHLIWN